MDEFTNTILLIAEQQGWSHDTLGNLALGFLGSADAQHQEAFINHLRSVQEVENEVGNEF